MTRRRQQRHNTEGLHKMLKSDMFFLSKHDFKTSLYVFSHYKKYFMPHFAILLYETVCKATSVLHVVTCSVTCYKMFGIKCLCVKPLSS